MKIIFVLVLFLFSATMVLSARDITLPPPEKKGGMDMMEVFNSRKTVRKFSRKPLSFQQISNLCWAANGINRKDGKRTAPSAVNCQEIEVFVLLSQAAYYYNPKTHILEERAKGDFRKFAGPRFNSPAALLLIANQGKQMRLKNASARDRYAAIDAGYVSQNIYLYCASANMGTVAVGGVADKADEIRKFLKLGNEYMVLLGHPVGNLE